jgi:hypothetical protein
MHWLQGYCKCTGPQYALTNSKSAVSHLSRRQPDEHGDSKVHENSSTDIDIVYLLTVQQQLQQLDLQPYQPQAHRNMVQYLP